MKSCLENFINIDMKSTSDLIETEIWILVDRSGGWGFFTWFLILGVVGAGGFYYYQERQKSQAKRFY